MANGEYMPNKATGKNIRASAAEQAAGADIVEAGEHEFEDALGEGRQGQQIERRDHHGECQDRHRGGAVGQAPPRK